MLSADSFTFITIAIYLFATAAGLTGLACRWNGWRSWGCKLALAAFFCQTLVLIFGFHKTMRQGLSMGAYLQMLVWFAIFCGIAAWWRLRHEAILLMATPLALILYLMSVPSLHLVLHLPATLSAPFYALHIGSLFLSLGLLGVAFMAAIVFLFLEKRIKARQKLGAFWQSMPAIAVLDKVMGICALTAFPFYTIGIIAGLFWGASVFARIIDPKQIISLIIWILLAILFHNRLAKNWTGRKPARLVIAIFSLSLFSFVVVNFLVPTQHAFMQG